ncbi:MAG: DUF4249 domain-containing protein [Tannerellaceae bacterium]|jgi:hypothetical protein|nr:DUF4249 domain-containing protein [Tannerellaceae bacterium]
MKHPLTYILLVSLLAGCIQEFIPRGVQGESGVVVVDGMIRDGESVFKLSYSVAISDTLTADGNINTAEVYVEANDGSRIRAAFTGDGTYVAQTPSLDTARKYRFTADINGETYESEYLAPIVSVAIDSVFAEKRGDGEPVNIFVASHDDGNGPIYYHWNYREIWEVKADLYANARWGNGGVIFHSLNTSENTYYCWGRDSSKNILLASTEKLSENLVAKQKLLEIPCDDDRLSILYRIQVEQMQIREAAYKYFADAKSGIERTGDLFTPVLTNSVRGNIRCANDPERPVIGYIEVATVTASERYVWEKEGYFEPPLWLCNQKIFGPGNAETAWPIYIYGVSSSTYSCVDCRMKRNATKDKPAGWPTEHL